MTPADAAQTPRPIGPIGCGLIPSDQRQGTGWSAMVKAAIPLRRRAGPPCIRRVTEPFLHGGHASPIASGLPRSSPTRWFGGFGGLRPGGQGLQQAQLSRRRFLTASVSAAVAVAASPAVARGRPIRLGVIGISFHAVAGAVVQAMLERLGMEVIVQTAPHDEMFRRLGAREVDLLVAAWMPGTHQHLFTPYADRIAPIATLYRDARLYWAVPGYVPEERVASVADLALPDVSARMERTILSIGPSAGLSVRSAEMLAAYGLEAAGYRLEPGDTAVWLEGFRTAHAAGRWLVMPLWQPHFLNRTHALRVLADPKAVMGGADDAVVMANIAFARSLDPRHAAVLGAIDIGLDGITDMDLAVNAGGMTAAEAAAQWLGAHADRVAAWLEAAP